MKQVGWFVVGYDGKFGRYLFENTDDNGEDSPCFVTDGADIAYWENRGYEVIPAYVSDEDAEEYTYNKRQNALDKMAENEKELGLEY